MSGHPEGPSTNPDDWKSPYSTGPGQTPGYGQGYGGHDQGQQDHGQQGYPGQDPAGQGHPGQGHGHQDHGVPGYGGQDPGAPGYGGQGYGAQEYGTPGYGTQEYGGQGYGTPGYGTPGYGERPYGVQGYDQQAYGEQPYGRYPPQYGYGPVPHQNNEGVRTHAIVALVISIVLGLTCYISLGGIAGAIMSGIALGKVDTDPRGARNLLKWSWIAIGVNVALLVLGVGALIVVGVASSS
ncbi:hypothetical protein [Streptosporangium sp. NPDC006007]|uniref:hypothetical protein n=1 Tax=Streptosporangium sp. NPDC006007 TaxID=3154575 RepID=UPI0033B75BE1